MFGETVTRTGGGDDVGGESSPAQTGGRAEAIIEGAMTPNVAIEDRELLERYAEIARSEGKTVDELTTEAVKRDVARRWLERNKREAQLRRGSMTDEEVESIVQKAVQESRAEQRAR